MIVDGPDGGATRRIVAVDDVVEVVFLEPIWNRFTPLAGEVLRVGPPKGQDCPDNVAVELI
jgi:hypothetical protein